MSTVYTKLNPLPVGKLSSAKPQSFDLQPGDAQLERIAGELGLISVRKLRLQGHVKADGATDWMLRAKLGATVTQSCVVTLDPVTTRIDEPVLRRYLKTWPDELELGDEVEIPEDDSIERLRDSIDILGVLQEALSLALPTYPRADGAMAEGMQARPEGAAPITAIDDTGLSALSELKKKLEDGGN